MLLLLKVTDKMYLWWLRRFMGVSMQYVRIPVTAAVTRETHSLRKGLNKDKHKYKHNPVNNNVQNILQLQDSNN